MKHPKLFRSSVPSSTRSGFRGPRASVAIAGIATASLVLVGCSTNLSGTQSEEGKPAAEQPVAGTPATPAESPKAGTDLSGEVKSLPINQEATILDAATVSLAPKTGQASSAFLTKGAVYLAASDKIGEPKKVDVDDSCDNLNTTAKGVAIGCDGHYLELDAGGAELRKIEVEGHVKSATTTDDGRSVIGVDEQDKVAFYNAEGKRTSDEVVSRSLDMAVLVKGRENAQRVAVIDRGQTTINDVDPGKEEYKASLRIGQGVGEVAAGTGTDTVVVASDNRQDQVMIYTMDDVVRLHQAAPTKKSPWGVAWDSKRGIALVSTTADNLLSAYDIASGTPTEVGSWKTIADVRHVLVQPDGSILLVGKNNELQRIAAEEVDKTTNSAKSSEPNADKKFPVELKGSEEK